MEEKTLFAFRAPEIGEAVDKVDRVVSNGGELLIKIRSRKQKIANGDVVIETTTPSCKATINESWISSRVEVDNQYNILDVYFNIEKNTSSNERTSVITVTQDESGKKLTIHIIQPGVTYTGTIELPQLYLISLDNKKGASTTFEFTAYLLGSDGSKVAENPSITSSSTRFTFSIKKGSSEYSYVITFTANSTNASTLSRIEEATIYCGTASKNIKVTQKPAEPEPAKTFTLRGLPINQLCFLFASGHRPQSISSNNYLIIPGLNGSVDLSIPCTVNLSTPGQTMKVNTGYGVTVWEYNTGNQYSQIGSFTVPSAGESVSI